MAEQATEVGTAAVAAYHRVTQKCVREWAHRGELPATRNGKRGPLNFQWADVIAFRRAVTQQLAITGSTGETT